MKWFKLHSEFSHDPKLATFSKVERCDLIDLLCLANESDQRGLVDLDKEDIAATLSLSLDEYEAFEDKLTRKGIVTRTDDGLAICNWEKRQYQKPSDAPERVAERVAKHRESIRNTDCNAYETPCNALDTDTDTETEETPIVVSIAKTPREKPRDIHFELIAECWLGRPYPELKLTRPQQKTIGMAATELKRINAPPERIATEWVRISRQYDDITPHALVKHWDATGGRAPPDLSDLKDPFMRALIQRGVVPNGRNADNPDTQAGRVDQHAAEAQSLGPGVKPHGGHLSAAADRPP